MKQTPPGSVPKPYPTTTGEDIGKVLVVDSNDNPTWGNVVEGDIPLGADEFIGIFKE